MKKRLAQLACIAFVLLAPSRMSAQAPRFEVTRAPQLAPEALDGRLLLILSTRAEGEPRFHVQDGVDCQQVLGLDVEGGHGCHEDLLRPRGLAIVSLPDTVDDRGVDVRRARREPIPRASSTRSPPAAPRGPAAPGQLPIAGYSVADYRGRRQTAGSIIHERHNVSAEFRCGGGLVRSVRNRDVSPAAPMDGFTAFLTSPPPAAKLRLR